MAAANRAVTIPKVTTSSPITRRAVPRRVAAPLRAVVRTAAASGARAPRAVVSPAAASGAKAPRAVVRTAADRTTIIRRVITSIPRTTREAVLPVSSRNDRRRRGIYAV